MNGARVGLAGIALALALAAPVGASPEEGPTVAVDRTGTIAGEQLLVSGAGWAPGALVRVELCGNAGRGGSVDCDVANGRAVIVGVDGTFTTPLVSGRPPRPCPCVILADSQSPAESATVEIAVAGVATVPLDQQATPAELRRELEIARVRVEGSGPWQAWFGAAPRRELVLTLRNAGVVPLRDPPLSIAVGAGEAPGRIIPAPAVGRLEPGEVRNIEVPFELDALAFGSYTVEVEALGFVEPITAQARTTSYPWGLFVLGALGAQVMLLRVRNRLRRRIARGLPAPAAAQGAPETQADPPPNPALPVGGEGWAIAVPAGGGGVAIAALDAMQGQHDEPGALGSPEGQAGQYAPEAASVGINLAELERALEEHRWATAQLAAWVVSNLASRAGEEGGEAGGGEGEGEEAGAAGHGLAACPSEASVVLRRANELAEALLAARGARADELLAAAQAHEAEAARRHEQARAALADARARADELLAVAEETARELEELARAERERARAAYQAARAESAALVSGAREELAALLSGLDQRVESA